MAIQKILFCFIIELLFYQFASHPHISYIPIVRQEHKLAHDVLEAFGAKKSRVGMSVHVESDDVRHHAGLERPQEGRHIQETGSAPSGQVDNIREAERRIVRTVEGQIVGGPHGRPYCIEDSWGKASGGISSEAHLDASLLESPNVAYS